MYDWWDVHTFGKQQVGANNLDLIENLIGMNRFSTLNQHCVVVITCEPLNLDLLIEKPFMEKTFLTISM